jgi:integrase
MNFWKADRGGWQGNHDTTRTRKEKAAPAFADAAKSREETPKEGTRPAKTPAWSRVPAEASETDQELRLSSIERPGIGSPMSSPIMVGWYMFRIRSASRSASSEGRGRGSITVNKVKTATPIKISRRDKARPEKPTKEELKAIITVTPDRSRPLVLAAIFTGLRGSELRGLKWTDVDLKAGELHVRRRVDRFNRFGPPKSEAGTRGFLAQSSQAALSRSRAALRPLAREQYGQPPDLFHYLIDIAYISMQPERLLDRSVYAHVRADNSANQRML